MNWKWLETHTQFDDDSGADGGGIGDVGGDAGPSPPPENVTETGQGEAPPSDPGPSDGGGADDPPSVPFNTKIGAVFDPRPPANTQPPQYYAPPAPRAPAASPQLPSADMWQMEPDKAAAMQQAYLEHKINEGINTASQPVREMQRAQQAEKQVAFQSAAAKAKDAVQENWEKVLNRDRDFRGNEKLQELTSQYIGHYIADALNYGSVEDLQFIATTRFARRALSMAKADIEDLKAYNVNPSGGPQVVGPQGAKAPAGALIDDDTAGALDEASEWLGRKLTAAEIAKTRADLDKLD